MLNQQKVLNYIKDGIGFPFMHVEWSDEKIIEYCTEHTLSEFSHFQPDKNIMNLNLLLEANQVPGKGNEWYLNEPKGREIFNVVDIYFPLGNTMLFGHPPMGILSHGELKEFALSVTTSITAKLFSDYDYTFEFKHPNRIRISPNPTNESNITVEYERTHAKDLGTIPNEFQYIFKQLALADIMIALGRIRKRYSGNVRTPFGEIPLEDSMFDEGRDLKRDIIEKLDNTLVTNVVIDHG